MRTIKIYLRKDELKMLKFIKKKKRVSEAVLLEKFNDFDSKRMNFSLLIIRTDEGEIEFGENKAKFYASQKGIPIGQQKNFPEEYEENPNKVFYTLSREGYQYFDDKTHERWLFWFPYTITTLIATASLLAQILG